MYFANFLSNLIFLVICVYFDLKDRIIPNKFLKFYLFITLILITFEIYYYIEVLLWYIIIKSLVFMLIFILAFILFSLKLIGGGDGKVLILLFHSLPFMYLFYFLKYFFLICGSFLIIVVIFNYIIRAKGKNKQKREMLTKVMNSILYNNSKINFNLKREDLRSLRKKCMFPLLTPIFFSYLTMIIYLLFIL